MSIYCAFAASGGHENIVQCFWDTGCPMDTTVCSYAASNGHIKLLKWARAHGCPWNVGAVSGAAQGNQFETLKWLRENGCPWAREEVCHWAAENGQLEILKWAIARGDSLSKHMSNTGHNRVAEWVKAGLLVLSSGSKRLATDRENEDEDEDDAEDYL